MPAVRSYELLECQSDVFHLANPKGFAGNLYELFHGSGQITLSLIPKPESLGIFWGDSLILNHQFGVASAEFAGILCKENVVFQSPKPPDIVSSQPAVSTSQGRRPIMAFQRLFQMRLFAIYRGWNPTQVNRDYNKPLSGSLLINQEFMERRFLTWNLHHFRVQLFFTGVARVMAINCWQFWWSTSWPGFVGYMLHRLW